MNRLATALLVLACACNQQHGLDFDLNRMIYQPKVDVYEPVPELPGGTSMQVPPQGTVARDAVIATRPIEDGLGADGQPVAEIPVSISKSQLAAARNHFMIYCKPCHGATGDADTPVARVMQLRKPPPLVVDPVRSYPPGRIYRAITNGYGLMPTYADRLSMSQRWGVVAYVQALQLARNVRLDELPPEVRDRTRKALRGGASVAGDGGSR